MHPLPTQRIVQAVRAGDVATVRALLDRHPALVNSTTDRDERIAPSDARAMRLLHVAISENQFEIARLLVERGADLNARNADGRQPLHDCFELGRDDIRELLLHEGAEPDVAACAAWGMLDRLQAILERDPRAANDCTTGTSPLGWSAYGGQRESARMLFAHGASVDRPPYDWMAWGPATMVGATGVAAVFLDHGADPNCPDEDGDTPLHAVIGSRIVFDPTAFVDLLLDRGADPARRNNAGQSPLDIALSQVDRVAETYYPVHKLAPKKLDAVIRRLGGNQ